MSACLITGSLGLVGSTAANYYADIFEKVIGIDNDQRFKFFGTSGWGNMCKSRNYEHYDCDIRGAYFHSFLNKDVKLIIHTAAQPSHDWAKNNIKEDFLINCVATVKLLDAVSKLCPEAVVIFTSTNKVYGDYPNKLDYEERESRFHRDLPFNESTPIDNCLHSFFGCSKLSADVYCQEYAKNMGLKIGIFRAGCITGPSHGGAELHGFLSYLVKCIKAKKKYTIYGYKGKQVRDNLHASDLVAAFDLFYLNPKPGVYNIGGGENNCSVLEAINYLGGCEYDFGYERTGDHKWWITDNTKFEKAYGWRQKYTMNAILDELYELA